MPYGSRLMKPDRGPVGVLDPLGASLTFDSSDLRSSPPRSPITCWIKRLSISPMGPLLAWLSRPCDRISRKADASMPMGCSIVRMRRSWAALSCGRLRCLLCSCASSASVGRRTAKRGAPGDGTAWVSGRGGVPRTDPDEPRTSDPSERLRTGEPMPRDATEPAVLAICADSLEESTEGGSCFSSQA